VQIRTIIKLFLPVILAMTISTCFAASVNWQPYSSATFDKAKAQHRNVLLFGKANWCPWCRRMRSSTFTDSSVESLINKHYIPVMIDIDTDADLANQYQIKAVPTIIILNGDKKILDTTTGYQTASDMAEFLRHYAG
jgi:thioredoxin-related protein